MGPDADRNIAINPTDTHQRSLNYITNHPRRVKWTKTMVSASKFSQARATYEATRVGKPYRWWRKNSNYAVKSVIRGSDDSLKGSLGWIPGFDW